MTRALVVALAMWSFLPSLPALGTDRVILGKRLTVEDPSSPDRRRVRGSGKESATDVPALSDPRVGGATLTVIANGATDSAETFVLDAAGWSASGSGYRYTGPTGADGDPVKRVSVKRTSGGRAAIAIKLRGNLGTQALDVVPPSPGTSGGFILDVAGGDRYCVQLGGAAGGTTRDDDARRWDIRDASAEAGCPAPDPVCGNGVREGTEQCDGADVDPLCTGAGWTDCFPAGDPNQCECCVPPAGYADFGPGATPQCCNLAPCQPVGPGVCLCPGTCGDVDLGFPTCGGSCPAGTTCVPLQNGGVQFCGCAPPGPCDGTCAGSECPPGQACDYPSCFCFTP